MSSLAIWRRGGRNPELLKGITKTRKEESRKETITVGGWDRGDLWQNLIGKASEGPGLICDLQQKEISLELWELERTAEEGYQLISYSSPTMTITITSFRRKPESSQLGSEKGICLVGFVEFLDAGSRPA